MSGLRSQYRSVVFLISLDESVFIIDSEAESVLGFEGERSIGGTENRVAIDTVFLDPSLIEYCDDLAAGTENPSRASLPAEVPGFIVKLDQIEKRQQRRHGVIGAKTENPRNEISFGKSSKRLVKRDLPLKIWRHLVLEGALELVGAAGIIRAEMPLIVESPTAFG